MEKAQIDIALIKIELDMINKSPEALNNEALQSETKSGIVTECIKQTEETDERIENIRQGLQY